MRILCTQTKDLRLLSFWDFFFFGFYVLPRKSGLPAAVGTLDSLEVVCSPDCQTRAEVKANRSSGMIVTSKDK